MFLPDLIVRNCGISKAFPNYRQPRGGSSSRATKNNDNKGGKTLSDRQSGEGFSRSGARRKMGAIHRDLLKHANVIRGRSALLGKDEGEEEDGATGTGRRFHDGNNSDLLSGPRIIQGDKSKKGAWPWQVSFNHLPRNPSIDGFRSTKIAKEPVRLIAKNILAGKNKRTARLARMQHWSF